MAQPAVKKFEYQVATAVDNLIACGVDPHDIILLYTKLDSKIPIEMKNKFGVNVYIYEDKRPQEALNYIPSIRPYLWWKFLFNNPQMENEDFVYQDADIVYRKIPNFNTMNRLSPTHWYGSDTESYTGPDYIASKGKGFLKRVGEFLGVSESQMKSFKGNAVGAQWVISRPKASYWKDVYEKSYTLYAWLLSVEHEYDYVLIKNGGTQQYWFQVWVAEMIAEAYLCAKYGVTTEKSVELNFSWSTDPISFWNTRNILHDAGVTEDIYKNKHLFYKSLYDKKSPFNEDLSWVNHDYCSWKYAQLVMATALKFK